MHRRNPDLRDEMGVCPARDGTWCRWSKASICEIAKIGDHPPVPRNAARRFAPTRIGAFFPEWRLEMARKFQFPAVLLLVNSLMTPQQVRSEDAPVPSGRSPQNTEAKDDADTKESLRAQVRVLQEEVRRLTKQNDRRENRDNARTTHAVMDASTAALKSLDQWVRVDEDEIAIDELCSRIQAACGVSVVVESRSLEKAGLSPDSLVSLATVKAVAGRVEPANRSEVSGLTVLNHAFRAGGVFWRIDNGVVRVSGKPAASGGMSVRTYPVADLVVKIPNVTLPVPKPNKDAAQATVATASAQIADPPKADFAPLVQTLISVIGPASWEEAGGSGSIRTHDATLSLVIRQTPQFHEQIGELLSDLRRIQDVQVTLRPTLVRMKPDELHAILGGASKDLNDGIVVDARTADRLAPQKGDRNSVAPLCAMTLFSEQKATIPVNDDGVRGAVQKLMFRPVVSGDRRTVWLDVRFQDGRGGAVREPALRQQVPATSALLIDMTPSGQDPNDTRRVCLLVPGSIIVQEEEEELLPVPDTN